MKKRRKTLGDIFRLAMKRFIPFLRSLFTPIARLLRYLAAVLLCYFGQACLMPHFHIMGVAPNLVLAGAAVITVCYPRLRVFWTGCIFGILFEVMSSNVKMLNLALYPLVLIFTSIFFCDKSDAALERERIQNKEARNLNPYLRIVLCAFFNIVLFETVSIGYLYITGISITVSHLGRAGISVLLTTVLAASIMVPMRKLLGFPIHTASATKVSGEFYGTISH